MNWTLWAEDFQGILRSKRTSYSIAIMAALALLVAIIVRYSPEGLREALEASAPGASSVFEYLWIEDVLVKPLLLIFVSFGSFVICDLEDERLLGMYFSRGQSRLEVVLRRLFASLASFLLVFMTGAVIAAAIGGAIAQDMDFSLFVWHHVLLLPLCLFVISLTFLLSAFLGNTAPTVIVAFGITLALSFAYTFLIMAGDPVPSEFNPLALGYRVLTGLPLEGAIVFTVLFSGAMLTAGALWISKKDL